MKKLLKSVICGSMNSARVHYSPWKKSPNVGLKKRKKRENADFSKTWTWDVESKQVLISSLPLLASSATIPLPSQWT